MDILDTAIDKFTVYTNKCLQLHLRLKTMERNEMKENSRSWTTQPPVHKMKGW